MRHENKKGTNSLIVKAVWNLFAAEGRCHMPLRYAVETCPNNPTVLHMKLNEAADNGGRVLNVIWQQEHESTITRPTMTRA